ncbi:hypothetical protein HELRODRAFT_182471 [Helobdella robusta]|uniref:Uncharacterized protein n=1 Tax=Helobdella robusta TaxID=6412 RepID=T1FI90_HELRO|nr:hypothetical protein HELRODRAFT_182471 [Helobdella robusta]ESN90893.1 hypothetical protein HELRODRAFT_182471 [Helobdella robusta]
MATLERKQMVLTTYMAVLAIETGMKMATASLSLLKVTEIPVYVAKENLSESLPSDLRSLRTSDLIDVQMLSNKLEEVSINDADPSQQTGDYVETTVQINLIFVGIPTTLMVDIRSYSAGLLINSSKYNPQNENGNLWVITDHLDVRLRGLLDDIFSHGIYLQHSNSKWIVHNINEYVQVRHPVCINGEFKDPNSYVEFTDRVVVQDEGPWMSIEIILPNNESKNKQLLSRGGLICSPRFKQEPLLVGARDVAEMVAHSATDCQKRLLKFVL